MSGLPPCPCQGRTSLCGNPSIVLLRTSKGHFPWETCQLQVFKAKSNDLCVWRGFYLSLGPSWLATWDLGSNPLEGLTPPFSLSSPTFELFGKTILAIPTFLGQPTEEVSRSLRRLMVRYVSNRSSFFLKCSVWHPCLPQREEPGSLATGLGLLEGSERETSLNSGCFPISWQGLISGSVISQMFGGQFPVVHCQFSPLNYSQRRKGSLVIPGS